MEDDASRLDASLLPDELDDASLLDESMAGSLPVESSIPAQSRKGSAAGWVAGDTTGFPSDVAEDSAFETARACVNPEFRELAEWTVEATLFNLVRELEAARAEEAAFDGVGDEAARWDSAGEESFEYDGRSEEE